MTDIPERDRGSSPTSVPVKDRRLHVRQRVASLTYVDLGENNGGIVLNVSEAGVRIQAAAALEVGPISLRLQLPGSSKRLELNAEVIWVGPSRKEAGLYFMDLSEDARSQIRKWIARETSPETLTEEDESDSDAEAARVEPELREPAPVESSAAVAEEPADEDELAIEDEFFRQSAGTLLPEIEERQDCLEDKLIPAQPPPVNGSLAKESDQSRLPPGNPPKQD